jgi:hypothetical protein
MMLVQLHKLFVKEGMKYAYGQNCALLGYYGASSGNFLPTFRDNLSVPSSREEHVVGQKRRKMHTEL